MSDTQTPSGYYLFTTGEKAKETLDVQHKRMAAASHEQLNRAGLRPGMTVWDVGCGTGVMTEYLAQIVGPTGHVYALDGSTDQLAVTTARLAEKGYTWVTYVQSDIEKLDTKLYPPADIVFSRLVLMHCAQPEEALARMHALLVTGGMLSLQESTMNTSRVISERPLLVDMFEALARFAQTKGGDFNIGRKLPVLCMSAGFSEVESYTTNFTFHGSAAAEFIEMRLDEWGPAAVAHGIIEASRLTEWRADCETLRHSTTEGIASAEQTHILARK